MRVHFVNTTPLERPLSTFGTHAVHNVDTTLRSRARLTKRTPSSLPSMPQFAGTRANRCQ
jgi:hypothetical protein